MAFFKKKEEKIGKHASKASTDYVQINEDTSTDDEPVLGKHAAVSKPEPVEDPSENAPTESVEDTDAPVEETSSEAETVDEQAPVADADVPSADAVSAETTGSFAAADSAEVTGSFAPVGAMAPGMVPGMEMPVVPKKKNVGKIVAIVVGVVVVILTAAYIGVALYFSSHFMPNAEACGKDISSMDKESAQAVLDDVARNYKIAVSGDEFEMTITADECDFKIDTVKAVDDMIAASNPWVWPANISRHLDLSSAVQGQYDKTKLANLVTPKIEEHNAAENVKQTTDAHMDFDKQKGMYVVVPEVYGTKLVPSVVLEHIGKDIASMMPTCTLGKEDVEQPKMLSTDSRFPEICDKANALVTTKLELTSDGKTVYTIDGDVMKKWVDVDFDKLQVNFDEEGMNKWIDEFCETCNTVGAERTWTRPDGKVCTVKGGVYGSTVDTDQLNSLIKNAVASGYRGKQEIPFISKADHFAPAGERDWGNRYIDVDLSEQHARMYDDNNEIIWETDIITGTPDGKHDTPTGVWSMNQKASPSKLVGEKDASGNPEYITTVSFWMPFIGNAIGLHDATWQPGFGGSMYRQGYGSHGCVNISYNAAQELYGICTEGDVVVTHW